MIATLTDIAAFLKAELPNVRQWREERLMDWLTWHTVRRHVVYIAPGGNVLGVIIARGVDSVEDAMEDYKYNDDGKLLHVEQCAAKNKLVFQCLLWATRQRFPHAITALFQRDKSGDKMKQYSIPRILKAAKVNL